MSERLKERFRDYCKKSPLSMKVMCDKSKLDYNAVYSFLYSKHKTGEKRIRAIEAFLLKNEYKYNPNELTNLPKGEMNEDF